MPTFIRSDRDRERERYIKRSEGENRYFKFLKLFYYLNDSF